MSPCLGGFHEILVERERDKIWRYMVFVSSMVCGAGKAASRLADLNAATIISMYLRKRFKNNTSSIKLH